MHHFLIHPGLGRWNHSPINSS